MFIVGSAFQHVVDEFDHNDGRVKESLIILATSTHWAHLFFCVSAYFKKALHLLFIRRSRCSLTHKDEAISDEALHPIRIGVNNIGL